jgi:hypothetical protein
MNNAWKILIGVLGFAGFLAFLVPTQFTASQPDPSRGVRGPAPAPPPTPVMQNEDIDAEEELIEDDEEEDDEEDFGNFGDPMIDGKPYGSDDSKSNNEPKNPAPRENDDESDVQVEADVLM